MKIEGGFFDNDGNELNPNLVSTPSLCCSCKNDEEPSQEIFCDLTRLDQQGEKEFQCYAYKPKFTKINR